MSWSWSGWFAALSAESRAVWRAAATLPRDTGDVAPARGVGILLVSSQSQVPKPLAAANVAQVTHPTWPLFDLRLTNAAVTLRPMTEIDLATVADILPDDLELNPDATTYPGLDTATGRRVVVHQEYWQGWGRWSIPSWVLTFVVEVDGRLIGTQTLEGEDFPMLRTVDSASWLVPEVRGRGIGKAMRAAVLALAFGPLEAQSAVTSAWDDNHASLGVSRAIGYRPNGRYRHRRDNDDGVGSMVHLRLTREDWLVSGSGDSVQIRGFEKCRPYFGV